MSSDAWITIMFSNKHIEYDSVAYLQALMPWEATSTVNSRVTSSWRTWCFGLLMIIARLPDARHASDHRAQQAQSPGLATMLEQAETQNGTCTFLVPANLVRALAKWDRTMCLDLITIRIYEHYYSTTRFGMNMHKYSNSGTIIPKEFTKGLKEKRRRKLRIKLHYGEGP